MVKQMLFQQNVQLWEYDKEQWGYFNQNSFSDKTYTVSFPIVFTNTLYIVTAIDKGKGDSSYSGGNGGNCIQSYTTTNFTYFSGL